MCAIPKQSIATRPYISRPLLNTVLALLMHIPTAAHVCIAYAVKHFSVK